MWSNNEIIKADLEYIVSVPFINWNEFRNSSVFITGGTGLIGSWLVNAFSYASLKFGLNVKIKLLVRNELKAKAMFQQQLAALDGSISFVENNLEDFSSIIDCDYVIHAANPTSSQFFAEHPVDTIKTAVLGTMNILESVKNSRVKGFVYLSSMEVYGNPTSDEKVAEDHPCNLDLSSPRSSYPESKRLCESLCISYFKEVNVPVRIIRLTQTFGPGIKYDDQRVFAQFARSVIENKNIVLVTKGQTKRSYLYTAEAVTAILLLLLNGKDGAAYNAANEETYCSIFQMAILVAEELAFNKIKVEIHEDRTKSSVYAPVLCMNLDTTKLRDLGWSTRYGLIDSYRAMIACMK